MCSMSQSVAGRSQPGARQVRSRARTNAAGLVDGMQWGSTPAGAINGRSLADFASSATTGAGISPSAPSTDACVEAAMHPGIEHTCSSNWVHRQLLPALGDADWGDGRLRG